MALFHDLIGKGDLKGYRVMANHGSQEKYDGIYSYRLMFNEIVQYTENALSLTEDSFNEAGVIEFPPNILEYKYNASSLIDDFESDRKSFSDIKLLIWAIGDDGAYSGASDYRLPEIDPASVEKQFYGTTHFLKPTSTTGKIHVIILEDVINTLVRTN